jgi:type II secretory pathway pseudopilin PulG
VKAIIIRRRTKTEAAASLVPMHVPMHARDASGFSLMQLLVVVAIFVVVAGIAAPHFLSSVQPVRIRNDANAIANLVVMARMRASTEFAHVEVLCTTNTTPATCVLESSAFPNPTSFTANSELQKIYLSSGVSFGIPASITGYLPNQSSASTAYQGDAAQGVTTTPAIPFNSRGLPVDVATGVTPTADYALYLTDVTGHYYAIVVNLTGRPDIYQYANGVFTLLQE